MTPRRSVLSSAAIALALVLSACGSSTDDAASGDDETTTTVEETTTTEAPTTTVEKTTTEAPTTTVEETTTTVAEAVTDASDPVVVAYCEAAWTAESQAFEVDLADTEALPDFISGQIALLEEVEPPAAIAADVATTLAGFQKYPEILERYDWDFNAAVGDIEAEVITPEFEAAGENLDAFEAEFCPNNTLEGEDDTGTEAGPGGITIEDLELFTSTPEGRSAMAQGMSTTSGLSEDQALCFIENSTAESLFALFQIGLGEGDANSPEIFASLEAGAAACGFPIEAFAG